MVVADDGDNTIGNPCPVVDRKTGTIFLLLTHNLGKDTERTIRDWHQQGTRSSLGHEERRRRPSPGRSQMTLPKM